MTLITYRIKGQLLNANNNRPLPRLKVEAWDKDLICDDLVGSAISDEQGRFEISFDSRYYQELFFDRKPDLFFKIFKDAQFLSDTKNSILWNLSDTEKEITIQIDLPLNELSPTEPLEFDKSQLLELAGLATQTPNQIKQSSPDLYTALFNRAGIEIVSSITSGFDDASDELKTLLAPLDLMDIALNANNIPDSFLSALITDNTPKELQLEIRQKLKTLSIPDNIEKILLPDTPLNQNPIFMKALDQATLFQLGDFVEFDDTVIENIIAQGVSINTITGEQLSQWVDQQLLSDDQANVIGLHANLYQWTGGDFDVMAAVKAEVKSQLGRDMRLLQDAVSVLKTRRDVQELLENTNFVPPAGINLINYATNLHTNLEANFPTEIFSAQFKTIDNKALKTDLTALAPVFSFNSILFGQALTDLVFDDIPLQEADQLKERINTIQRTINRFPGQQLNALLNETNLSDTKKAAEATRRMALVGDFYTNNPNVSYLSLDYMPDSTDLEKLDFSNMNDEDKSGVLETLMANQRLWNIADKNAEVSYVLMEKGYYSAGEITEVSKTKFVESVDLEVSVASNLYHDAGRMSIAAGTQVGTLIDERLGGLTDVYVGNASNDISDYLRRLPGFADFLASQGNCKCEHCKSIISPSAYYVDLMDYIEKYITKINFNTTALRKHAMKLENRRPDLWQMPLTCESANELLPYLVIINEILENYIYVSLASIDGVDRAVIEDRVYEELAKGSSSLIHSFQQPFNLALVRLETYLAHFSLTRADIASTVLAGNEDSFNVIPQSTLGLSDAEYDLIATTEIGSEGESNFFNRLYGRVVAVNDENIQKLLPVMGLSRSEFTDLVKTNFVADGISITIKGRPRTGGVQTGVEFVDGLVPLALDRMHRFVRLWKKLPWSMQELDLVLSHYLGDNESRTDRMIPLNELADFYTLQQRFKLGVEEVCALYGEIPDTSTAIGRAALFDRLFNDSPFARLSGEVWDDRTTPSFTHPAHVAPGSATPEINNTVSRLLAGLGVNDAQLIALIEALESALSIDHSDWAFELNRNNLSILYHHAQLSRLLKLSITELFQLINLGNVSTVGWLKNIAEIESFLAFHDWWKSSLYSIAELSFVVNGVVSETDDFLNTSELVEQLVTSIRQQRSLFFSDTIFSLQGGVTEAQSRRIVQLNTQGITINRATVFTSPLSIAPEIVDETSVSQERLHTAILKWLNAQTRGEAAAFLKIDLKGVEGMTAAHSLQFFTDNAGLFEAVTARMQLAPIKMYRVSSSAVVSEITFILPPDIPDTPELQNALRTALTSYAAPGAMAFGNTLFEGVAELSAENSKTILAENNTLFVEQENTSLYCLIPEYVLSTSLIIPSDIPLAADNAIAQIAPFHISQALPVKLAELFRIDNDKLTVLFDLADVDLTNTALTTEWVNLLLDNSGDTTLLTTPLNRVYQLAILFKDRRFTPATLNFVKDQGGAVETIFKYLDARSPGISYWTPTLDDVRLLYTYRKLVTSENIEVLHSALLAYDSSEKFTNEAMANVSKLTGVEPSIVIGLNNILQYPTSTVVGNNAIEALTKLVACIDLVSQIGISGETLNQISLSDSRSLSAAADAIFAVFRITYPDDDQWQTKIEPFEDRIREFKRDALSDYILQKMTPSGVSPDRFITSNDLYSWFMIDTELEGCARTSRLVAGLSSLQLYVQRCLMNLEQNDDSTLNVRVDPQGAKQWEWRKNYRVWEANRKVFLWPENYIEPELRDNKTELFEELETELLQQDIDLQSSQDAFAKYLSGFEELSKLKIAGAYHDQRSDEDVLHLFGVTSSEPPIYYYRTVENIKLSEKKSTVDVVWNAWKKMKAQIPVRKVSPIVHNSRLYLFWVEITTRPENATVDGNSEFVGYIHSRSIKFISQKLDGSWSAPQSLSIGEKGQISDPLVILKEDEYKQDLLVHQKASVENATMYDGRLNEAALNLLFPHTIEHPVEKKPLLNRDDNGDHSKARDDYSLTGFPWDRIYPSSGAGELYLVIATGVDPDNNFRLIGSPQKVGFYQLELLGISDRNAIDTDINNYRINIQSAIDINIIRSVKKYFNDTYVPYSRAENFIRHRPLSEPSVKKDLLTYVPLDTEVQIINGALSDVLINTEEEVFYLNNLNNTSIYILKRAGTSLGDDLVKSFFNNGLDGFLSINNQSGFGEADLPFNFTELPFYNDAQTAIDKGIPDFTGPMGVYFREIFFHIPFLIANHLNSIGKFAMAQRWYHYILDPTSDNLPESSGDSSESPEKDRVWQYIEFRNHNLKSLKGQLGDVGAITQYETDPFNPHAIARLRLGAYKKSILMKYIDNLLDWGDQLFGQDTMESINEATLLYVMAADLLGERPAELGECDQSSKAGGMSYRAVRSRMRSTKCSRLMKTMENGKSTRTLMSKNPDVSYSFMPIILNAAFIFPAESSGSTSSSTNESRALDTGLQLIDSGLSPGDGSIDSIRRPELRNQNLRLYLSDFTTNLQQQACEFCIPPNKDLMAYWDRTEDRLFKIRNCMNISGIRRQLALYAPEIDPRLLVRARAAGLSLNDILENLNGELPPYRFSFLIAKAKEYVSALQGFGTALLGSLEKKDAEELARLRLVQQDAVLKKTAKLKRYEVDAAEANLEALNRRRAAINGKVRYYDGLVGNGLSELEKAQMGLKYAGHGLKTAAPTIRIIAALMAAPPEVAGMCFSIPSHGAEKTANHAANIISELGSLSLISADMTGMHASFERREQGWEFSLAQANNELNEIEKQIEAATIRREISIESEKLHEESMKQLDETIEFYQDKFTNLQLYTWLSTQLQRFYRQTYQNAMSLARQAERAFRFERGDEATTLLEGSYWDSSHAGLLAGEGLMQDLRDMERKYMETNHRKMEINQAFSLTQINPDALLTLKTTGECEFSIPEFYFDLFYPGQYKRRIKSARLTIPCITGPYTNISANLTLTGSQMRKQANINDENIFEVPPTRTVSIATSTAQNDSGVFNLDFRDERYMPFEGAGAISNWRLSLPKSFRTFDYNTINDVILHISYTADYDELFREEIESRNASLERALDDPEFKLPTLFRLFSLRQEFSQNFHRLLHSPVDTPVPIELGEQYFPLFLQGREFKIESVELIIQYDKNSFIDDSGELPDNVAENVDGEGLIMNVAEEGREAETFDFSTTGNGDLLKVKPVDATIFSNFNPSKKPLLFNLTIKNAGNFAPVDPVAGEDSALDDNKLKDIILLIKYSLVSS